MSERQQNRVRTISTWRLRTRALELGRRTLLMGVVNITPDSFSDGGCFSRLKMPWRMVCTCWTRAQTSLIWVRRARAARSASAQNVELPAVSAEEEQERLLPVLTGILKIRPDAVISVDTYKAATARAALAEGAEIVNDVSGFMWDESMAGVCANAACGVVLMHTAGASRGMEDTADAGPRRIDGHGAGGTDDESGAGDVGGDTAGCGCTRSWIWFWKAL